MKTKPAVVIHLEWSGPFTWKQKDTLTSRTDYGIYQIYGCHPVYGSDTLLYIGKADDQTFAKRLKQEDGLWRWHEDFSRLAVYVGRLSGWGRMSRTLQSHRIGLAEKLLIFAHRPAYNAQKNIEPQDPELQELHVLNWGCHRSLLPEASGSRYTSRFDLPDYRACTR